MECNTRSGCEAYRQRGSLTTPAAQSLLPPDAHLRLSVSNLSHWPPPGSRQKDPRPVKRQQAALSAETDKHRTYEVDANVNRGAETEMLQLYFSVAHVHARAHSHLIFPAAPSLCFLARMGLKSRVAAAPPCITES